MKARFLLLFVVIAGCGRTPLGGLPPLSSDGGFDCGNGIVEPGEQCDDGNTLNFDGCSSTCRLEAGCIVTDVTG